MPQFTPKSNGTARPPPPRNEPSFRPRRISDETPLLAAVTDVPYSHGASSPDEVLHNEDLEEIDPDEFDKLLTRTTSYNGGIGVEPESQETAMLRGPRRYSGIKSGSRSRRSSYGTLRRPSVAGSGMGDEEALVEEDEDEPQSPYLTNISVKRFWLVYGGILANLFVACFDMTIMASSHPVITSYFNASNSASWLSTAFLLTSTSFQPIFGRLSDTIGRKPPYIFTMTIFLIGTIWCALAQSITGFILARAVCGLGAGGMLSMGSIITSDLVPIESRGVYQSYINIVYGLGSALGAAIGGAIADSLGWRWEFGIQVPYIAICTLGAALTVPNTLGLKEGEVQESFFLAMKAFDYTGSLLLTISVTFLILGLNVGGNILPWSHWFVILSLCIFAVCFPLFAWNERKASRPIMPLGILLHSPRANIIFTNAIGAIIVNAVLFNVPLYTQAVLLETATNSGLRLLVPTISSTITGVLTGFLITWSARLKWPMVAGAMLMALGTTCLTFSHKDMPSWLHLLFLVPSAAGQGFMFPGCFIALLAVSEQAEQAVVTSTLILWRSLGMVLGVAISSLVVQNALVIYLNQYVTGPNREWVSVSFPLVFSS